MFVSIINAFNEREVYKLGRKSICPQAEPWSCSCYEKCNCPNLKANGIDVYYFFRELTNWRRFRYILLSSNYLKGKILHIHIIPIEKQILDYKWNELISYTVWQKIELENLMSWLSTLGGGFSALGDHFMHHAETAGKISLRQFNLGIKVGDPFIQARCLLYYSISLIQTGKLRPAKKIIRKQYEFACSQKEIDQRLVKMCQGIWLKLQYAYKIRNQHRQLIHKGVDS